MRTAAEVNKKSNWSMLPGSFAKEISEIGERKRRG